MSKGDKKVSKTAKVPKSGGKSSIKTPKPKQQIAPDNRVLTTLAASLYEKLDIQ